MVCVCVCVCVCVFCLCVMKRSTRRMSSTTRDACKQYTYAQRKKILSIESNFGHGPVVRRNFLRTKTTTCTYTCIGVFLRAGKSAFLVRFKRQYQLGEARLVCICFTKTSGSERIRLAYEHVPRSPRRYLCCILEAKQPRPQIVILVLTSFDGKASPSVNGSLPTDKGARVDLRTVGERWERVQRITAIHAYSRRLHQHCR